MSSIVERFISGTYRVKRSGPGTYLEGFYRAGDQEEFLVRGSLQPTNARELKLSEEGSRLKQYWEFYTDKPIVSINTKTLSKSDTVVINDETYKVLSQEIWQGFGLTYYKATISREPEQ